MMKYRIEWISLLTDYRGHGSWLTGVGNDEIDALNKAHRHVIYHWLVGIKFDI